MMSSMCSMPTDSRTSPGVTPAMACCSAESWLCVVDAGWITSERTSPMLATCEWSSRASTKRLPASAPPARLNATTAPVPLGPYLRPRSYHGLDGRPA